MRYESIFAAVARTVVNVRVCTIFGFVAFVAACRASARAVRGQASGHRLPSAAASFWTGGFWTGGRVPRLATVPATGRATARRRSGAPRTR